jgi:hypothetical protein
MMVRDFAVGNSSAQASVTKSVSGHLAGQPWNPSRAEKSWNWRPEGLRAAAYLSWPWRRAIAGVAGNGDGLVDVTFPRSKTAKQMAQAANQSWIRTARAPLPPMSRPHTASALSGSERVSR